MSNTVFEQTIKIMHHSHSVPFNYLKGFVMGTRKRPAFENTMTIIKTEKKSEQITVVSRCSLLSKLYRLFIHVFSHKRLRPDE